jgi:hypothetical protein
MRKKIMVAASIGIMLVLLLFYYLKKEADIANEKSRMILDQFLQVDSSLIHTTVSLLQRMQLLEDSLLKLENLK